MFGYFIKRSRDILGLNARSLKYTMPHNLKHARKIADSKLDSKLKFSHEDLPVPETFAIINDRTELNNFDFSTLPKSFVLKPNRGLGGDGIKVVFGRKKNGNWVTGSNKELTEEQLRLHVSDILDGNFSLRNAPDVAFFERRLMLHPDLKLYSYKGIPDVRVIVYNNVPVMAMLRLPTRESGGKANLQMGGIGVGIDITTGKTTYSVVKTKFMWDRYIDFIPGTRIGLRGVQIPFWDDILKISIEASKVSNLGYAGVDIAIDKEMGPVILEVNARPGLSIQNANLAPLAERLRRVSGLRIKTARKGISVAKELFGTETLFEAGALNNNFNIVGIMEKVKFFIKDTQEPEVVECKVDTGAGYSSISYTLLRKLGYGDLVNAILEADFKKLSGADGTQVLRDKLESGEFDDWLKHYPEIEKLELIRSSHGATIRPIVRLPIKLAGKTFNTKFTVINRENMAYQVLIGRRSLKGFLVNPQKNIQRFKRFKK
jgi:alpha-L-glutamate ligase-like protein